MNLRTVRQGQSAPKYLLQAAPNLVECVAFAASMTAS